MCYTFHCAQVVHLRDVRGRWQLNVQSSGPGEGTGMSVSVRGKSRGKEVHLLHAGGTHFLRADGSLSDTPLPERFQIVLDFTILDLKAWNAVMDRFHLQDICEQILQEQQKGEMNSMELERLAEYAKALYQSVKMSEI